MDRFAPILSRMNRQLVLPQPLKHTIMKEIAADLEDTFTVYRQKGFDEQQAEAKTLEKIAADDSVINDLIEIHETPVRKMLRRLSDKTQYRIELGLWISFLLLAGMIVSTLLAGSEYLAGSPFNWLTGGIIIGISGISLLKYYELFVKKDHSVPDIHRGLSLLIFISGLTFLTGMSGFFRVLRESAMIIACNGFQDIAAVTNPVFQSISIVSFSFAAATAGAIVWLIFTMKVLTIEDQEYAFNSGKPNQTRSIRS